jgi:2-methylaconitate cis-trans-isomerase PrpF
MTPRVTNGLLEVPVEHVRGGTSTGILLHDSHLPDDLPLREELIRRIMGVPLEGTVAGNRQITGLGRGVATSNKVFIVAPSERNDADIDSTLAQLAADKSAIDWSVNCGNMSAALPFFALDHGMAHVNGDRTTVRIFNTNTGVVTHGILETPGGRADFPADTEIPGVMGKFPGVMLALLKPAGSRTSGLLPTGNPTDEIDSYTVSCVDVAVPMMILRAADFGKTATETPAELDGDAGFKETIKALWIEAGLRMGMTRKDGTPMSRNELANSETIPKVCIVAPPEDGDRTSTGNIKVRYFTPQQAHPSMAVTGGSCLAAACLVAGTTAHDCARGVKPLGPDIDVHPVLMENPAGLLKAEIRGAITADGIVVEHAAYQRNMQTLLRGYAPVYGASSDLLGYYG